MMAPMARHTASNSRSNGFANGAFDAPPSTMAAQLINNLSSTNIRQPARHAEQNVLQKLLMDIEVDENNLADTQDTALKLQHKHKLIYVLTSFIFEKLASTDPFLQRDDLVTHAADAIDVFMSTIKEFPDVLNYCVPFGGQFPSRGQEPLWTWLFPRILGLLGKQGCGKLTEKIKDFFYVAFQVVSRSPRLWNLNSTFFRYLKDCIANTLYHVGEPKTLSTRRVKIVLPSIQPDYLMADHYDDDESTGQMLSCTYIIHDSIEGFRHASQLLLVLVDVSMEAASAFDATPAFQDYVIWMLDSFCTLHDVYERWMANTAMYNTCPNPIQSSLCAIYALMSSSRATLAPSLIRKGYSILSGLCASVLQDKAQPTEKSTEDALCACIMNLAGVCQSQDTTRRSVAISLVHILQSTLDDQGMLDRLGSDFKNSALLLCQTCGVEQSISVDIIRVEDFEDEGLAKEFLRLQFQDRDSHKVEGFLVREPPNKRRKVEPETSILDEVTGDILEILGFQRDECFAGFGFDLIIENSFIGLSNEDRCKLLESLGRLPCAASGHLKATRVGGKIDSTSCPACEGRSSTKSKLQDRPGCKAILQEEVSLFEVLIKSPAFSDSKKTRVMAMFTLKRLAAHYNTPDFLDLEHSKLGQWCVASLKSSVRELRIAAGRTLPAFLRGDSIPDSLTRTNRRNTMDILRSLAESGHMHLQETCVLAWAQLGQITEDDELCLVLLALVKYLSHSNPIISSVAFNEILRLAKSSGLTVEGLFSAFWGVVAIEAVKDLLVRPQSTQLMAELLGRSVADFLDLTQSYTLPFLVMGKKVEIIDRIAEATKQSSMQLLMHNRNHSAVFALLLQQSVTDMETYIMSLLRLVTKEFKSYDFLELLRMGPCEQAFLLLKASAEADESKKARIRLGLHFLADQTTSGSEVHKKGPLNSFLDYHMLGLVTHFSQVINDATGSQTLTEKRRCIKTIEELVKVAKAQARIPRPQLCAILQSTLSQKALRSASFAAWETMLRNMDDNDVEEMLESTFTMVIQQWDAYDTQTRERARSVLEYLLNKRDRLIRVMIVKLPSLSSIPELTELEARLEKHRTATDVGNTFAILSRRLSHENAGVVTQALIELKDFLRGEQTFLHLSASSEKPDAVVDQLVRSILDTCTEFNGSHDKIPTLAAECLGLVGCLDPNRVESVRAHYDMIVVSNFKDDEETRNFVLFALEEAIVPAFLSADAILQGWLSYAMQILLDVTGISAHCLAVMRSDSKTLTNAIYEKWLALPQNIQSTLTPFLTSKYSIREAAKIAYQYPIFRPEHSSKKVFNTWSRSFALDLLQKNSSYWTDLLFPPLFRAIKFRSESISQFLLPYIVLYVIIDGTDQNRTEIGQELLNILNYEPPPSLREEVKKCIEAVFRILDYLARWTQERQIKASQSRGHDSAEADIAKIDDVLCIIPPEIISTRAVECKSYARALYYWEQHIRDVTPPETWSKKDPELLEHLQDIYAQIDEPDGIDGISAHLQVIDINQQILGHRKAGRWTAAQSWYEIQLAEKPNDVDVQLNLLTCLRESGQLDVLLNYAEGMRAVGSESATPISQGRSMTKADTDVVAELKKTIDLKHQSESKLMAFATEASWATGKWSALEKYTSMHPESTTENFNVGIGNALLCLRRDDRQAFTTKISELRKRIASSMSAATTSSMAACHDDMLKFHVLTELDMIARARPESQDIHNPSKVLESLNNRLEVVGAYLNDKQYLLGIRRAAMQLISPVFDSSDIASNWLTSARLARKGNSINQAFNAVLHAARLGDSSATIEHARLLWKEGQHRQAIQSLQGAIASNAFIAKDTRPRADTSITLTSEEKFKQNALTARAYLLLAKWLDSAGQTNASALRTQYQLAAQTHMEWEKGHYYLGRHYNKLLEAEKVLPSEHQSERYLRGEMSRLVVENYLRSMLYGTKYLHQTLPRCLTLYLDLGSPIKLSGDSRFGPTKEFISRIEEARRKALDQLHNRWYKYINKLPAYMFYTALPQIVARIAHQNTEVFKWLSNMILKVMSTYPKQALWSLLAVCASTQSDRRARGASILSNLRNYKKVDGGGADIKQNIRMGERLCEQLLLACNAGDFQGNRTIWASLTKELGFQPQKCLPGELAVPVERHLNVTLPTITDNVMTHQAFSRDVVTIESFEDEVMVLSSLQKPRKLTARGSDGNLYGLMCKPKDDLRKDQRLMEFNGMINRSLKRDAESSRRQLYIKTYAVTPLNEECGIIEWVDGLKTLRDILVALYKPVGISPNYREIEQYCEEALKSEDKMSLFTVKVLGGFPPIFHKWFVQQFPEPSTWFVARLRYTRSCAVMSMVGTILGLGDRHGENILFEEGNGGTFHVDFNCLFDKGLTFVKPERVPFRLTHNMVDAMGMYGFEGPFRKSSELTLKLLRQHEDTLMTILEAFIYDPTLDLLAKKPDKKKREGSAIPQTPQGVLDSIRRKIRGLLAGESVPLGVEGQADELIKQATNQTYLAGMYIGWCSFF